MRKKYKLNKWEYEIVKNIGEGLSGYGYHLKIFKNGKHVVYISGFGCENSAENYMQKYIIENEFNIELSDNKATT